MLKIFFFIKCLVVFSSKFSGVKKCLFTKFIEMEIYANKSLAIDTHYDLRL